MAPNRRFVSWTLAVMSALAFVVGASAQQLARVVSQAVVTPDDPIFAPQDPQPPPQQQQQEPEQTGRGGGRGTQPPQPRPYDQVITKAAKTDDGIFKIHRIAETLFYEIPKAQLNKDFLWNTQIKKTTIGAGYGGQNAGSRVVRWVTKGDRVLLLNIDYSVVADIDVADRDGGRRRELPGDHPRVQRRGLQPVGRSGHRRHVALHDRRA